MALSGVRRLLRDEELQSAGYPGAIFGIAAEPGFCFSEKLTHKATHGYPADYPDYRVFYLISEQNIPTMREPFWILANILLKQCNSHSRKQERK